MITLSSVLGRAPLTNAERQRRYRERVKRNDPDKWAEIKKKNLKRAKKKYVPVHKLTKAEKKQKRKQWREAKHSQRH